LVRGEVKDVVEAAQILRIVAAHAPTGRRSLAGNRNLNIQYVPGLANDTAAVESIRTLLEQNPNIVNLLRVPGEQQVMLMVTVAEVNRTAARTIGMDFSITRGGLAFAQNTGQALNIGTQSTSTATSGVSAAAQALRDVGGNLPTAVDNGNVLMAIQALRTLNFARSLQRQAGELSGRRVLPGPQQHRSPRRRRAERDLPELRRLAAIHALYYRPHPHPPAIERQRIDPQRDDHPGQRGRRAE
jgi:hypothetical protein